MKKKKMVMDACTAILLAKSSVIGASTDAFDIILPESVYSEILKGKDKSFADAFLTENLVINKRINIKVGNLKLCNAIALDFGMGLGEAETIAIELEKKHEFIATDNRQGRKAAKIYGLPLIGSPEIIVALFRIKKISKDKTISALNVLKDEGWFDNLLIERIIEEVENAN